MLTRLSKRVWRTVVPRYVRRRMHAFYVLKFGRRAGIPVGTARSDGACDFASPDSVPGVADARPQPERAPVDSSPAYNYRIQSPKLGLIYFDVPKNASSTIKTLMFSVEHKNRYDPRYSMFIPFTFGQKFFPAMVVQWSDIINLPYTKFSFLRNPYERLVSGYRNTGWRFHYGDMTFEQFVESLPERLDTPPTDVHNNHYKPLSYFIPKSGGRFYLDFIGKIENFSNDFAALLHICNIHINVDSLLTVNTSKHRHYRDYYTAHTREIAERIYGEDIELGQYTF